MSEGIFAGVIIDISHEKVDRAFDYLIPEKLRGILKTGDCVTVPFGKGNSLKKGYVVRITNQCDYPVEKLKSVQNIVSDAVGVEADAIKLAAWIKNTYGSTMIAALKTVLPAKKVVKPKENKKIVRTMNSEEILSMYAQCLGKKQQAKARVLKEMCDEEILPYDLVTGKLHVTKSTLDSLCREGAIRIEVETTLRNPVSIQNGDTKSISLSDEQRYIVESVTEDMDLGIENLKCRGRYLIHGITGSGKTEVYIKLIEENIKRGKATIMLIPEISLTYQTLLRFYKHFGDRVSVINSSMTPGERYDQCLRAQNGDIDVIIGPRSALFVPFPNLGMVIVDEEHDNSYISEQTPKYHTVETADELCRIKNAVLVLGSATPSLESYHRAKNGEYKLFLLTRRLTGGSLADVSIVDLRQEMQAGNRSIFSRLLKEKIEDRLSKGQQIMLFLNRRGFSGFISCRACGYVVKCPHCDVSMSRHRGGKLLCHYCGYETKDVSVCPECGSKYITGFKAGTQQIEDEIHKLFPSARVLRMDKDTTQAKDSYDKILSAFSEQEADILVGTQMIVKGHDFPNVTLVGVVAADISLNESDFKSGERTFQLLTQAVGRAGRGKEAGEAIIQTYRPDHYSIVMSAKQDYEAFYEEEFSYRMLGDYPPAGDMLQVLVQSKDDRRALGLATALAKRCVGKVRVIGPSADGISKINDYYRYNIYLKSSSSEEMIKSREAMEAYLETAPLITELVSFDVK